MASHYPSRIAAATLAVFLSVFVGCSRNSSADASKPPSTPPATQPAKTPAPAPTPAPSAPKAGKTPTKPAPALTADTLAKVDGLLKEAKALNNDGVAARTAGKNDDARKKQSEASDKLEAVKTLTEKQWEWLQEAELGDWALTAEYTALAKVYDEISKLDKRIRMGGGTR
jgi:hypothetical protein